jgi:hypothetical protein
MHLKNESWCCIFTATITALICEVSNKIVVQTISQVCKTCLMFNVHFTQVTVLKCTAAYNDYVMLMTNKVLLFFLSK